MTRPTFGAGKSSGFTGHLSLFVSGPLLANSKILHRGATPPFVA
jgi:hypothetical protein